MLEVQNIHKSFTSGILHKHKVHAVNDVSFAIPNEGTFGIVGNSGCGKSTLARMMVSLISPDSGKIIIDGRDILSADKSEKKELTQKIQIIFQHPESSLDPSKKIRFSLLEPMVIHRLYNAKEREEKMRELLNLVDLKDTLLDRYPHQISGGEAQRIMIARALSLNPSILVLDEPTSMLDVSVQAQVMTLLKEIQAGLKLSYLFISHDISVVEWFCDNIAVMQDGRFIETGRTEDVLNKPREEFTRQLLSCYTFD